MNGSSSYEKWGCIGSIATAIATVLAAIIGGAFLIYANSQQNRTDSPPPVTVIIDAPADNSPATAPPTPLPITENILAELNVINNGTEAICYMYISLSTADGWGSDQLGSQEKIQPGNNRAFNVPEGEYDFRAKNCDDAVIQESYNNMVQGTTDWSVDQTVTSSTSAVAREDVGTIDVNVEYDIYQSDRKGMLIKLTFSVSGYKDIPAKAIAYFETKEGESLKDLDGDFSTTDGNVSASVEFQPDYDHTDYTDLEIFIPYEELHLGGVTSELRFLVQLYDTVNKDFFGTSDYYEFSVTY